MGGTATAAAEVSQGLDRQPRVANHVPQTKQCAVCAAEANQTKQCVLVRPRHCCQTLFLKVKQLPAS